MSAVTKERDDTRSAPRLATLLAGAIALAGLTACSSYRSAPTGMAAAPAAPAAAPTGLQVNPPAPDPRVGLAPGMFDAGEAIWNLSLVSATPPPDAFVGKTNSDLAFSGPYAIQGNYDGIQIWDISDPTNPQTVVTYVCPASQSDVSVYENLLFVSGEGFGGRLDCGDEGVEEAVSHDRLRGIRIFDISDITAPEYVANVQTCRGSHTHTLLEHPGDDENVYVYVSGSAPVRPAEELPGCSGAPPSEDPNSALFRIEVIRVPLADPASAEIVSSPRIFEDLVAPPTHGPAPDDLAALEEARARGAFIIEVQGQEMVLPEPAAQGMLGQMVAQRGGEGPPTAADSAALREALPTIIAQMMGQQGGEGDGPEPGPTQCHDITVYPAIGLAGGACEGYGMLLDISDPENPRRLSAVADSNFSYWHSATFNNDGTAILFTDEWGGGGAPKCRASDPMEWGANAIFTIEGTEMEFQSYFKLPAPQTPEENCVAHNGSLIPIPGRDIMIQGWYQGGISLLDWTDTANPVEIAYFDRGPVNPDRMADGRQLVRLLVQRCHRQLRDRPWARHPRTGPERGAHAERDRRRQLRAVDAPELAGSAHLRVARDVRAREGLPGPVGAARRSRRREDRPFAGRTGRGRGDDGIRPRRRAPLAGRRRIAWGRRGGRRREGPHAGRCAKGPRGRGDVGTPGSSAARPRGCPR